MVRVMADLFHHDGEAHGVHLGALAAGQRLHDDMLGAVDDDLRRLYLADALVVQNASQVWRSWASWASTGRSRCS